MRSSSSSPTTPADPDRPEDLGRLVEKVQACTVCAANLPHSPRPVLRVSPTARLLIVGQAPGRRVHETGIPWNDPSGDLLRQWLGMTREQFYDATCIAIVPPACATPARRKAATCRRAGNARRCGHPQLIQAMPQIRLTL